MRSEYPVEAFGATIFDIYPDVQFYDYTKIAKRFERPLPDNYHLSLSYSQASEHYKQLCIEAHQKHNASLVIVVRDDKVKARKLDNHEWYSGSKIDGDEHDLRFLDPDGSLVYLKAKGNARKDASGFVID